MIEVEVELTPRIEAQLKSKAGPRNAGSCQFALPVQVGSALDLRLDRPHFRLPFEAGAAAETGAVASAGREQYIL